MDSRTSQVCYRLNPRVGRYSNASTAAQLQGPFVWAQIPTQANFKTLTLPSYIALWDWKMVDKVH